MDFEWSNRSGPVDQQSPFITAPQAANKRKFPGAGDAQ